MIIVIPPPGSRSPLDDGLQFVGGDVPPLEHDRGVDHQGGNFERNTRWRRPADDFLMI
jgi:hypothetical protein